MTCKTCDIQVGYDASLCNRRKMVFSEHHPSYSILYQKLGGHTVWGIRLLHCTRLLGTHGYLVGSGEEMVSGNLPIESGHAQGCFFFLKNGNLGFLKPILGFWKPSESIGACSRLLFFVKNGNLGVWKPSESIGACSRLFFVSEK